MTRRPQTALVLLMLTFSTVGPSGFGATRGAEGTILAYDATGYKGAVWKIVRGADKENGDAEFRSITGWDANDFLIAGCSKNSVLFRRYRNGTWSSQILPINGHYAEYRTQCCGRGAFLFSYSGRSGERLSLYEGATETQLGDWSGLGLHCVSAFGRAAIYRFGSRTYLHPCCYDRPSQHESQVFETDGTAIEEISRGKKGYFIKDPTGKEAGLTAGSIAVVHAPNAAVRIGVGNYEAGVAGKTWKTSIATLRDGVWTLDKVLPFETGMVVAAWAHSEGELIICGQRGAYIYEKGQSRTVNLPGNQAPRCAWGKDLKNFFILTRSGTVLHFVENELREEVADPDLRKDASAQTSGTPEGNEKLFGGQQQFRDVWVSPDGVVYAVRSRDLYSLAPTSF
jgi:hypothetical protein